MPCKWRASARKRHKLSLYGCLVLSSNVRQLTVPFLNRSLGKTALLHPIGTSFSKAANTVKFVNLQNLDLFIRSFSATRLYDVILVEKIFQLCQVVMGAHKFGSIQQGIVFVCVRLSEPSVSYIFQNEAKSQIHFCCTFQIVEKMIKFLIHDCFLENFHSVVEYFVSRSFKLRTHQEMLTGTQLFAQSMIFNISHNMFHIHISCF